MNHLARFPRLPTPESNAIVLPDKLKEIAAFQVENERK